MWPEKDKVDGKQGRKRVKGQFFFAVSALPNSPLLCLLLLLPLLLKSQFFLPNPISFLKTKKTRLDRSRMIPGRPTIRRGKVCSSCAPASWSTLPEAYRAGRV